MSLTGLLAIARGALVTHERAVGVIGHNIANAETPGYSRQHAGLTAEEPQSFPFGQIGRGVKFAGIDRLRNTFYDQGWRREASVKAQFDTLAETLSQVTGVLGEPGGSGLSASLDALIDSFHTLAGNPVDSAGRALVVASATALTDRFRGIDARLDGIAQNIGVQLGEVVRTVNSLARELNSLNGQIKQAGGEAPDLLDRRDVALDRLSQYLDVRVAERDRGAVDVTVGGLQLVASGGGTQTLSIAGSGPYQLELGEPPVPVEAVGGKLKGLFDASATIGNRGTALIRATGLRGQLDDFALGLVSAVNEIHSDYSPGTKALQPTLTPAPTPLRSIGALFDPAGVTAASIRLDSSIVADPTLLAAGYSTNAGDNTIALRLGQLRTLPAPVPGATGPTLVSPTVLPGAAVGIGEYYTGVVSGLGLTAQDAGVRAAAQAAFVDHLAAQRQDVSGVSIDEEMVRLIEHQQAYSAAARLVQVADEMLRELINLGR